MNATLTTNHQNRDFPARIPPLFAAYTVAGFDPTTQRVADAVTLRLYASPRAGRIHACTWIYPAEGAPRSGHGAAGGGGYCRRSAAGAYALEDAGVELTEDVAGRGESALRAALLATAAAARPDLIGLTVINHEEPTTPPAHPTRWAVTYYQRATHARGGNRMNTKPRENNIPMMTATEILAYAAANSLPATIVKTFRNGDQLESVTIDGATTKVRVPAHMVAA